MCVYIYIDIQYYCLWFFIYVYMYLFVTCFYMFFNKAFACFSYMYVCI